MTEKKVRVRFAPSPTGPLHIGGVRTALYNYLFARKHKGIFLLRIEDTDQSRYVTGAEEYIINSLKWCGIKIDEGVTVDGPYAPYRQSERKEIYKQYAEQLIKSGYAYYAFDTTAELEEMRKNLETEKASNTSYSYLVRKHMKNSLSLSAEEVEYLIESDVPYVIRFKILENEDIRFQDLIRGEVIYHSSVLDDKILYKSDGMPTYHLANVVDDHLMQISHVIRGEEWLSSTPLHILLYKAFGWDNNMPYFAHLPLLLKPDGKGKLSKRDGDKMGFPVFPLQWKDSNTGEISSGYRESGYFPEAFINFLAFLGWNPGSEKEKYDMDELIQAFSFEHVHKSGARFDFDKAKWFNHQYLISKSDSELADQFITILIEKNIKAEKHFVEKVCNLMKERVNFANEIWDKASFFFEAPKTYNSEVVKKHWKDNISRLMIGLKEHLASVQLFTADSVKENIHKFVEVKQAKMGDVMSSLRLCLVGDSYGPDLSVICELLGKDEVVKRIERAVQTIH
jgi:glutamyl-tRNA synthetase